MKKHDVLNGSWNDFFGNSLLRVCITGTPMTSASKAMIGKGLFYIGGIPQTI